MKSSSQTRNSAASILLAICCASPALAGTGSLPNPQLGPNTLIGGNAPLTSAGGGVLGAFRFTPPGITETSGGYFSASCGWAPTASGTYIAPSPLFHTGAISGVSPVSGSCGTGATPDLSSTGNALTQLILQVRADSPNQAQLGLFVNMDDVAGNAGYPDGSNTQHPAAQISALRRNDPLFPNGPGSLWGLNVDWGDAATIPGFSVGEEFDGHANNVACSPLGTSPNGCFSVMHWDSFLSAFPMGADILINTQGSSITTGTVNIAADGVTVTQASRVSGGACGSATCLSGQTPTTLGFSNDTSMVTLNGAEYRVSSVTSTTQLTLLKPYNGTAAAATGVPIVWSSHALKYGIQISDALLSNAPGGAQALNAVIREADFQITDRARTVLFANGLNDQGINFSGELAMRYAMLAPQGSQLCMNGTSQCLSSDGTRLVNSGSMSLPPNTQLSLNGANGGGWTYNTGIGAMVFNTPGGTNPLFFDTLGGIHAQGTNGSGGTNTFAATQVTTIKVAPLTVATLATCNTAAEGTFSAVTDATSPTYNGTLTGGASMHIPVYCNGTVWTAH